MNLNRQKSLQHQPFKCFFKLLNTTLAELNLREAKSQIATFPLRRISLSKRVANLFDECLTLLVALDKRKQISDNSSERLFRDCPLSERVRVRSCCDTTATAQLTDYIRHGIVNDQAIISL